MSKPTPARLHVLLAAKSSRAVVVRRGPSKHVATFLWDRARDTFEPGQWLHGRLYERRSDLSADGRWLLYFAANYREDHELGGSWTAVSRAPYLKAVALHGKGDGWHGGGLWTGERTYWLNDGAGHRTEETSDEVERDPRDVLDEYDGGGECLSIYVPRLRRAGWQEVEVETAPRSAQVFERELGESGFTLRKLLHAGGERGEGKGVYWEEHELVGVGAEARPRPDWEWADWDGERLLWAQGGRLHAAPPDRIGAEIHEPLRDFNGDRFQRLKAPY